MLVNPVPFDSLPELLTAVLGGLLDIGVIVLTLAFVFIGFSFVRAQGNPEALKKAKNALLWTVIGGAILLGAQLIAEVIKSTVDAI
ncbi:MAG: hypothetical protein AB203_00040 [Parcubacteria bacterium C7867-008]|nr:MAG: hypothetical protein AB203_00040 [Parcubacteria bacterium C7867-008]